MERFSGRTACSSRKRMASNSSHHLLDAMRARSKSQGIRCPNVDLDRKDTRQYHECSAQGQSKGPLGVYGWGHLFAGCADPCRKRNTGSKSHRRNNEPLREQQEAAIRSSADGPRVNFRTGRRQLQLWVHASSCQKEPSSRTVELARPSSNERLMLLADAKRRRVVSRPLF